MNPSLSISVVSHGQMGLALRMMESLARHAPPFPIEVLLTENLAKAAEPAPSWPLPVLLHVNDRPQGLAANQNAAVARSRGEFVCLLNPDVVFVEEVFASLVQRLRSGADIVAPTIVDGSGVTQESGRKVPHPLGLIRRRLIGSGQAPGGSQATPPDWIAGTFLLFRAETFRSLQGMDERFRLYFEDVDLGCRATLQGMRLQIDPDVRVVHEARRASARSLLYLLQHTASALRFFRSPVFRQMRRRSRASGILDGGPPPGEDDG